MRICHHGLNSETYAHKEPRPILEALCGRQLKIIGISRSHALGIRHIYEAAIIETARQRRRYEVGNLIGNLIELGSGAAAHRQHDGHDNSTESFHAFSVLFANIQKFFIKTARIVQLFDNWRLFRPVSPGGVPGASLLPRVGRHPLRESQWLRRARCRLRHKAWGAMCASFRQPQLCRVSLSPVRPHTMV